MAKSRIYPPANRTAQWWETKFSRGRMPVIDKILLHTTETTTWPSYEAGAKAPTLTYNPWTRQWRQHNYLDTSARALQDPASTPVRENRDGVIQIEITCYCDPKSYRKYGKGVNALPATAYEDLGAFVAFAHLEWGVPLTRTAHWATFPPPNSIRMGSATYDKFKGLLGHQHAPGNDHGDPGFTNAQVDRILAVARRIIGAPTGATPSPPKESTLSAAEVTTIVAEIKASEARIKTAIANATAAVNTHTENRVQAYANFIAENREQTMDDQAAVIWATPIGNVSAAGAIQQIRDDVDVLQGKA